VSSVHKCVKNSIPGSCVFNLICPENAFPGSACLSFSIGAETDSSILLEPKRLVGSKHVDISTRKRIKLL
jgi:hypothetical protein